MDQTQLEDTIESMAAVRSFAEEPLAQFCYNEIQNTLIGWESPLKSDDPNL